MQQAFAIEIPIGNVKVNQDARHRGLDLEHVERLKEEIAAIGVLLEPIVVNAQTNELVCGWHRLEACRLLGWRKISAQAIDLDPNDAEIAEIQENLVRKELDELSFNRQAKRLKELYEAKFPETKGGGDRKSGSRKSKCQIGSLNDEPEAFVAGLSEKTGKSTRKIHRGLQIAESLPDKVVDSIAGTPVANCESDLLYLAKAPPEERDALAAKVEAGDHDAVRGARRAQAKPKSPKQPKAEPAKSVAGATEAPLAQVAAAGNGSAWAIDDAVSAIDRTIELVLSKVGHSEPLEPIIDSLDQWASDIHDLQSDRRTGAVEALIVDREKRSSTDAPLDSVSAELELSRAIGGIVDRLIAGESNRPLIFVLTQWAQRLELMASSGEGSVSNG